MRQPWQGKNLHIHIHHCRLYCSKVKVEEHKHLLKNIRKCLKQKQFKQYTTNIEDIELTIDAMRSYFNYTNYFQILFIAASEQRNVFEETLILDLIGLIGSLGGSFGLFVGFSFFGYITPVLEALFDKAANLFQQTKN